ncbi:MAG TPA: HTH domain-containing protein [Prolixibacteraceae bacterium]|nr:HTH domain-containing protein [Prolixibacteraceae bacterium]
MSYVDAIRKLDVLERQIEQERTGNAEELSGRLRFSRRTLFNYFDLLKEKGYTIKYCRRRNTYYFDESQTSDDK